MSATCADRCVGHCCRLFYLPYSPDELATRAATARVLAERGQATRIAVDAIQIAGMVREVAAHAPLADAVAVRSGFLHHCQPSVADGKVHWYTCANLREDGNCAIYAQRPRMCSAYPYGEACLYAECGSAAARAGTMGDGLARRDRYARPLDSLETLEAENAWR